MSDNTREHLLNCCARHINKLSDIIKIIDWIKNPESQIIYKTEGEIMNIEKELITWYQNNDYRY